MFSCCRGRNVSAQVYAPQTQDVPSHGHRVERTEKSPVAVVASSAPTPSVPFPPAVAEEKPPRVPPKKSVSFEDQLPKVVQRVIDETVTDVKRYSESDRHDYRNEKRDLSAIIEGNCRGIDPFVSTVLHIALDCLPAEKCVEGSAEKMMYDFYMSYSEALFERIMGPVRGENNFLQVFEQRSVAEGFAKEFRIGKQIIEYIITKIVE
jgi:hypothetical protein